MTPSTDGRIAAIVDLFFNHGIVKVDTAQPFTLSSGAQSPIYLDHRRAFSDPKLRRLLVSAWADRLEPELKKANVSPKNVVCVGTATAGIAPAMALALHWDTSFVYVRQKPKGHGLQQMVEGIFEPSRPHLVIDDMLTTGQSLWKTVEVLRALETRIAFATTVTSHGVAHAHQLFDFAQVPFASLLKTSDILMTAQDLGLLSQSDLRSVMAWLETLNAPVETSV